MKYVQADIHSLLSFILKKLSDIVASFINTGQMQYYVLPFYFLALCFSPAVFVLASSNSNQTSSSQKPEEKPPKLPPPANRLKNLNFKI